MIAATEDQWHVFLDFGNTITKMGRSALRELLDGLEKENIGAFMATGLGAYDDVEEELAKTDIAHADLPTNIKYGVHKFFAVGMRELLQDKRPERCILVDDTLSCVETAMSIGMHGIHFRGGGNGHHEYCIYSLVLAGRTFQGGADVLGDIICDIRRLELTGNIHQDAREVLKT